MAVERDAAFRLQREIAAVSMAVLLGAIRTLLSLAETAEEMV